MGGRLSPPPRGHRASCRAAGSVLATALLALALLFPLPAAAQRAPPPAEDGKARRTMLMLVKGEHCTTKSVRGARNWLLGVAGMRSATVRCRRASELEIVVSCRRGAASACSAANAGLQMAARRQRESNPGGFRVRACVHLPYLCDAYHAGTGFKSCVYTDPRCNVTGEVNKNIIMTTPMPGRATWPALSGVSCGGAERLLDGGSMLTSIQLNYGHILEPTGATGELLSILCRFSDGVEKLIGAWNGCDANGCNNDTGVSRQQSSLTAVPFESLDQPIINLNQATDLKSGIVCAMGIKTANGDSTYSGCLPFGPPQTTDFTKEFVKNARTRVIDMWALLDARGKMYQAAFTVLTYETMQVDRIVYDDLGSQAGPLPAYNLGILVDSTKSGVSGDMSTSISLQNTQKIVLTASDTVGKEVSTSFSIMPKFDVPLPEYNQEEKWTTGNTILKSNSTQFSTTVTVGPKNAVKPGGVAALLLMAFNGSVTLPYTAFGKLIQGGDSMDVGLPGAVQMEGSMSYIVNGIGGDLGDSIADIPGYGTPDDSWQPTPAVPTPGYPLGLPRVYSAMGLYTRQGYVSPPPSDLRWCGDAMAHGSIKTITGYWADSATPEMGALIVALRFERADGTVGCDDVGTINIPGVTLKNASYTLRPGEIVTSLRMGGVRASDAMTSIQFKFSTGQTFEIGYSYVKPQAAPGGDFTAQAQSGWSSPVFISSLARASGVLDGAGLRFGPWNEGGTQMMILFAMTPVFLQNYVDIGVEINNISSKAVEPPDVSISGQYQGISSVAVSVVSTSMLQYDFGDTIKKGWSFSNGVKLDKFVVGKIPLQVNGAKKWTSSTETQKAYATSWSQTRTTTTNLNLAFTADQMQNLTCVFEKVYTSPADIPFNGAVSVTFPNDYVYTWPFSSSMQALDGSFTIVEVVQVGYQSQAGELRGVGAALALGLESAAEVSSHAELAKLLLDLPDEDPRKHQALGVYTVKANETTWEHVCGSCCSSQLVAELNGGAATPTAGSKIFMPTLG